jgi:hypothetical protein
VSVVSLKLHCGVHDCGGSIVFPTLLARIDAQLNYSGFIKDFILFTQLMHN